MTRLFGLPWWRHLAGVALVLLCGLARGQTIDDVSVLAKGDDMVARVTFNATVRFLQQSPTTLTELYSISFDLIAADESITNQSTDEVRRVAGTGAVPEFTLAYAPSPGRRTRQLTLRLLAPTRVKVQQGASLRSIDIVFPGLASQKGALAPVDKRYAVIMQRVPASAVDQLRPVPLSFQSFEVFSTNTVINGAPTIEVTVGYFATREEAEAVRRSALERFPQAMVVDIVQHRADLLNAPAFPPMAAAPAAAPELPASAPVVVAAAPPVAAAPASAPAPAPAVTTAESPVQSAVEAQAADLMLRARKAFAADSFEDAVAALGQLLLLPPNKMSQEAQELIGLARERAGDLRRARAEYELYLKLYPEGEGASRVAQRLAALGGTPSGNRTLSDNIAAAKPPRNPSFSGNIAQYYYGGKARSQSLVNIAAGIDQSTLTRTTESAIVTSLDLGARYVGDEAETRAVVRGTGSKNLLAESHSASLWNAAYVDYKRKASGVAVRVGRQTALNGGLLGLFDGVSMTYPFKEGMRLNLMGGVPANPLVNAPAERLFAAMVEADSLFDHWGGNLYLLNQTTQGITNRRAVGLEARYSDERLSLYSLVDYDTLFKKINAVTVQGSYQASGQTTITMLADTRKTPSLQMTNALISSGDSSLQSLMDRQALSLDEVRQRALDTTAQAKQFLVSVSRPLNEKWQIAGDVRYSEIGALPQVGDFEATEATGGQYGLSLQLTGSNLYSSRDINNFNISVLSTPRLRGTQIAYNNLTGVLGNDATIEPSIRFYRQSGNDGTLNRIAPGLRGSYRLSSRASLLGESVYEYSKFDNAGNSGTTKSIFFYLGYRYELF